MKCSKFQRIGSRAIIAGSILGAVFLMPVQKAAADWRPDMRLEYSSLYESNVFHSYADDLRVDDQMNELEFNAQWNALSSLRLEHELNAYAELEMYASNSSRNRYDIGIEYEPVYRYHRYGRIKLDAEYTRSKKDLIDDNGEVLSRTLGKNVIELRASNYYRYRHLKTRQTVEFSNYDYEDSYDMFGKPMKSYDYHFTELSFEADYDITRWLEVGAEFETEKRNYDERITLALDRRSSRIRNFRRNGIEGALEIKPFTWAELTLESRFNRRKENYEDFYGYDEWRHEAKLELDPYRRHDTEISFVLRKKDYIHYTTTNTGILHPVYIDYAIFRLEHVYRLSEVVSFRADIYNINKISNDPDFDYSDLRGGLGIILNF